MIFFTADEHFGHESIIFYCSRPFDSSEEMDEEIIKRHNAVVGKDDIVYHVGDFTLWNDFKGVEKKYVSRLNGTHRFIKGSHDRWLNEFESFPYLTEIKEEAQIIVLCHYAMRVWPRSHYDAWQVYGHSHGKLAPIGKQWDVGVDNNNFTPVSFVQLKEIMAKRPDNPDFIKKHRSKWYWR